MEAEVSEDGPTGQEGAAHAGEEVPVRPIGRAVWLRHVIGLLDHLTVHLKDQISFKDRGCGTEHIEAAGFYHHSSLNLSFSAVRVSRQFLQSPCSSPGS